MSVAAPPEISAEWRETITALPGFDPFAQAGDCVFDEEWAELACSFFPEVLRHCKGPLAGKPFHLEQWERALVGNLWGWRRPDGTRRFRTVFLYVGKKNGKTSLSAGLLLFGMTADSGPGSDCYSAAAARDQAALVFDHVQGMIRQDRDLAARYKVFGGASGTGHRAVTDEGRGISYKCLSADVNTTEGIFVHIAVIDELHCHKSPKLASILERSSAADGEPLVVFTTTADYDRESVCNSKLEYAKGVRDGRIDDPDLLPVIYEATEQDDWTDPAVWRKANPNFGVTIPESYFRRQVALCKEQPSELFEFLRLHLNVRTRRRNQWLELQVWREGSDVTDAVAWRKKALETLAGTQCWAGLDLALTNDMTAFSILFAPQTAGGKPTIIPWFWIPENGAWRNDRANANLYDDWIRRGFVRLCGGDVTDYEKIKNDIVKLTKKYPVSTLGIDPYKANQMSSQLFNDHGLPVEMYRQNYQNLNAPTKEFERLVMGRMIEHGKNPVLDWMVGNAAITEDIKGNVMVVKPEKNSPLKIDGIVASIMALGVSMANAPEGESVYEQRGLLEVEW